MVSILADRQYTLDFIKEVESKNVYELEDEIIQKINKLAKRVGAPSYQRTPVFKRNNYVRKIKKENITEKDWETIRNFKKTKLEKNTEGIEAQMDKIRTCLNKLTDTTYDLMLDNITCIMKDISKEENTSSFEKIGVSIFEIGSFNKFWSKLYVRIYKDLITVFPFMKDICVKNFNSFMNIFETINYIDAGVDYNLFCEYNKENEKRRALSNFFVVCAGYDIIDKEEMEKIVLSFIEKIKIDIDKENKVNEVEEIVENLSIIILNGNEFLKTLSNYDIICESIETFSNMSVKNHSSLSNKVIFKFMDLVDELDI